MCFGDTFYWVKIAAVRKISVDHEVMLTLLAKVRWGSQAEKRRQVGKCARRGTKCQRKLSVFNGLNFFSFCPGRPVMFCLRRGLEKRLLLPSTSVLIISVNRVALLYLLLQQKDWEQFQISPITVYAAWPLRKQKISTFSVKPPQRFTLPPPKNPMQHYFIEKEKILVLVPDLPLLSQSLALIL